MSRFWFLFLWPAITYPIGCGEALMHVGDRGEGEQRIEDARAEVDASGTWPVAEWWTDKQDPLGGWLDFASKPWVSAARGSGDCEDAMVLAEAILSGHVTHRVYIKNSAGWHAVLVWHTSDGWAVITNMVLLPRYYDTAEEAARGLFGDATEDIIID
ncbi:MAG: hypothetical protein QGD90_00225 [Candidatus Hydrogenedentes bacterium]|nr:hypothetical protein [Candidatus Hydrogenedentota bacterium]